MTTHLVVVRPFGGFARGDLVRDDVRISDILAGENAALVVRVVATASLDAKQEG
jgi:hypothetical protein